MNDYAQNGAAPGAAPGGAQNGSAQNWTGYHSPAQPGPAQNGLAQHGPAQHGHNGTAQHSAPHAGPAQNGIAPPGAHHGGTHNGAVQNGHPAPPRPERSEPQERPERPERPRSPRSQPAQPQGGQLPAGQRWPQHSSEELPRPVQQPPAQQAPTQQAPTQQPPTQPPAARQAPTQQAPSQPRARQAPPEAPGQSSPHETPDLSSKLEPQARKPGPRYVGPGKLAVPPVFVSKPAEAQSAADSEVPTADNKEPAHPAPAARDDDPLRMTTELEPVGEMTKQRRKLDETLARFSAAHDEGNAEEQRRKEHSWLPWHKSDPDAATMYTDLSALKANDEDAAEATQLHSAPEEDGKPGESEPQTRLQEKKERKRLRSTRTTKIIAATAAGLVFLATGTAWGVKAWVDGKFNWVSSLDEDSSSIMNAAGQTGDENFLLVGSDTRAGAGAEEGVGDESSIGGARSDTVMIAHVPANRKRVVVVSFPRDLEIERPDCERWDSHSGEYTDEKVERTEGTKLNTAYQIGGPRCVTKLVQELSGMKINHFVGVDFHGFKNMVDAVGGVEVCSEEPVQDEVLGTILPRAGTTRISGDTALNFVRARHVANDPTSDYGRIKRQQRFLSALLRQAMSSQVLLDPGKLTGFVDAFTNATFGENLGVDQMLTLGQSLQGLDAGRVTFVTVPTVGESNENGNEVLRETDTRALFNAIINNTPLPGEKPANAQPKPQAAPAPSLQAPAQAQQAPKPAPVDPSTLQIQVLNGGNPTEGVAGKTADALAEQKFQVVNTANADEQVGHTTIKYPPGMKAAADRLASSVPGANLIPNESTNGQLVLILGPEFNGKVAVPPGAGPALPDDLSTVNAGDASCS